MCDQIQHTTNHKTNQLVYDLVYKQYKYQEMATNDYSICPRCEEKKLLHRVRSLVREEEYVMLPSCDEGCTLCESCGGLFDLYGMLVGLRKPQRLLSVTKEVVDGVVVSERSEVWYKPCNCHGVLEWTVKPIVMICDRMWYARICTKCTKIHKPDYILAMNKIGIVGTACNRCATIRIPVVCDDRKNCLQLYCSKCKVLSTSAGLILRWHNSLYSTQKCCSDWRSNTEYEKWRILNDEYSRLLCGRCCKTHPLHMDSYYEQCVKKNACHRCGNILLNTDETTLQCLTCRITLTNSGDISSLDKKCTKCSVVNTASNVGKEMIVIMGRLPSQIAPSWPYRLCNVCGNIDDTDKELMKKFSVVEYKKDCDRCLRPRCCMYIPRGVLCITRQCNVVLKCIVCKVISLSNDKFEWDANDTDPCRCGNNRWNVSEASNHLDRFIFRWCHMCSTPYSADVDIMSSMEIPACCYSPGTCQHCRQPYRPGKGTKCSLNLHNVCKECGEFPCKQAVVGYRFKHKNGGGGSKRVIYDRNTDADIGDTSANTMDRSTAILREHEEDMRETRIELEEARRIRREAQEQAAVSRQQEQQRNTGNGMDELVVAQYEHERRQLEERATNAETLARSMVAATRTAEEAKRRQLEEQLRGQQIQQPPAPNTANKQVTRCCVCLENERNAVIVPCGHIVMCYECAGAMVRKPCPMCSTVSVGAYRVYSP